MELFDLLGFRWAREPDLFDAPRHSVERAVFRMHRMLPEYVWDAGVLEGNKRTSRFMMNGLLMSQGIDAISVPAARAQEFNSKMVDFYITREATEMMKFVVDCSPRQ